MIPDPADTPSDGSDLSDDDDLFRKLDSLIRESRVSAGQGPNEGAPILTEPVNEGATSSREIPVLEDAVDPGTANEDPLSGFIGEKRRQLQVALYLRLRQRLDHELDAALADDRRLGAIAVHPAFTRVASELRAVLPVVVRESVEQVFRLEVLEDLLGRAAQRGRGNG